MAMSPVMDVTMDTRSCSDIRAVPKLDEAVFQSFLGTSSTALREGRAKYEAALWQECNGYFDCETEAYALLKDLQGRLIPRLYARVCLALPIPAVPQDLLQQPQLAHYLEVKGILL
ncbi:hypothetical protein DL765_000722 [Monosporascus sp. GIB2]|nr:hypothetical protein DL765_000722 [Monosporascus sp. GIB2]